MKRGESSKVYKKTVLLAIVAIIFVACFYISNYTPSQTIEVGEYKNYKMK
jgi:hypothetical protein